MKELRKLFGILAPGDFIITLVDRAHGTLEPKGAVLKVISTDEYEVVTTSSTQTFYTKWFFRASSKGITWEIYDAGN